MPESLYTYSYISLCVIVVLFEERKLDLQIGSDNY